MLNTKRNYLVQAHRGASGYYPENTLLAFKKAVQAGVDIIELDVHLTKDNKVVVIHDTSVERTTDGSGKVSEMTLDALKKLDAGSWFDSKFSGERIPLLREVFALLGKDIIYNIEIKTDLFSDTENWRKLIHRTLEVVERYTYQDNVIFTSFDLQALLAILSLNQDYFTALIDWRRGEEVDKISIVEHIGIKGWFPHRKIASKNIIDTAKDKELLVLCGTGKNRDKLKQDVTMLLEYGVNGVSTNYPGEVIDIIAEVKE
ncbi:MAG: glycerophosphodiester phosphodiesterase [Halanaerobiaceae bacterium]